MRNVFQFFYLALFTGSPGFLFGGCQATDNVDNQDSDILDVESDPKEGAVSFVSADSTIGGDSWNRGNELDDDEAAVDGNGEDSDRTVEEGDIYRVSTTGNIIFNLNSYRGLQVIDISDVENPTVIGRLPLSGYPVEMYVADDKVYMLMNNWQGYWGNREDIALESYSGGLLVTASVADLENPKEIDRALVPGYIMTSRLIGNDQDRALYVAASNWTGNTETVVKSFYLKEDATVEDRTVLSLGGYVQDIQASPNALMVARYDWSASNGACTVSVIDVSDPAGTMVEGAEIPVEGIVSNKTNMDLRGNILRIVSGSSWSDTNTNHLQTFDITNIDNPVAVDHDTFGQDEQLYATLFLDNKAFFVTYFQTDPFHAFEIDDAGNAEEKTEYVISGWNSFFKPVIDNTRIVGIGVNDDTGRQMSVSLYDITDLTNPNPFIARQEVDATEYSWSEATFDDKAFSVIEDAVSVAAPDGTEETGLILLPFSGYDSESYEGVFAVQMFTFSASTLTRRGLLSHGTPVRRSFNPDDDLTVNLSEQELSLFNTANPDAPAELGRVELAPNYDDLLVFGDTGVRVKRAPNAYYNYYSPVNGNQEKGKYLETVPLTDPEAQSPLASIEVGAGADVVKVGNLAAAISRYWKTNASTPTTLIQVVDFSNPLSPAEVSTMETEALVNSSGGYYLDYECVMYGYYSGASSLPVDNAIVFPEYEQQQEKVGIQKECSGYYSESDTCYDANWSYIPGCAWTETSCYCVSTNNEPEVCSFYIYECDDENKDGYVECDYTEASGLSREEGDAAIPYVDMSCSEYDLYRTWSSMSFYILDLTDPENPVLSDKISMPKDEESAGLLARGNSIYINYKIPYDVPNDSKSYARYYFKELDLSDPASPQRGDGINIPGVLREVNGDTIYTQDAVYGQSTVETAVNRLVLKDGKAVLQARKRFNDRIVSSVTTDKDGHSLVVHSPDYNNTVSIDETGDIAVAGTTDSIDPNMNILTILDMDDDMSILSEMEIDTFASLHMVKDNKALFSVPGGILLVNLNNFSAPFAQAYFPVIGWPFSVFINDRTIYMPSGPYGIYTFGTDTYNLMEEN